MRIWIRNTVFSLHICGLIITNLLVCDLRTGAAQKFVDFRYAEWAQELACPPLILETKSILALKINIVWNMADLIPYLVPTQLP